MHRVFISYHHGSDASYKDALLAHNILRPMFIDGSVDTGDIDENLPDQSIREIIRDRYLRDTTVTLVLVGTQTRGRKHVDWEIFSSMIDGSVNKKSGVIAILLPSATTGIYSAHDGERDLYPDVTNWTPVTTLSDASSRYPYLPDRLLDNIVAGDARVSVTEWRRIDGNPEILEALIEVAHRDRASCKYELSRQMRRANS